MNKTTLIRVSAVSAIAGLALTGSAFAMGQKDSMMDQQPPQQSPRGMGNGYGLGRDGGMMGGIENVSGSRPVAFGTVTAINGTTLTVAGHSFAVMIGRMRPASSTPAAMPAAMATTTYTVNASSAVITKNGATSTVSAITLGDHVVVQGTLSGTNITATAIRDGIMMGQRNGMMNDRGDRNNSSSSDMQHMRSPQMMDAPGANTPGANAPAPSHGFFGGIGGFFKKIFGF